MIGLRAQSKHKVVGLQPMMEWASSSADCRVVLSPLECSMTSSRSRWRSAPAPPPPKLVKHSTLWSRAHSRRSVRPTRPNSVILPRDDIKSSVFGVL
ncbi:unnamed protein product [Arctia plantaginis]|uniref:Uncharacterized protein n=1 Tax=Arctia plantaginis TaxID=874455 RepID=A0A8S1AAB8_ARCPL|nr:unnamed protein product [Arctia plantaginis]